MQPPYPPPPYPPQQQQQAQQQQQQRLLWRQRIVQLRVLALWYAGGLVLGFGALVLCLALPAGTGIVYAGNLDGVVVYLGRVPILTLAALCIWLVVGGIWLFIAASSLPTP